MAQKFQMRLARIFRPMTRSFAAGSAAASHIITSPFPDIAPPPYKNLSDFISADWNLFGSKLATTDGVTGESRTFSDLQSHTGAVAANLVAMGISKGDVLAIFSPNHVDFIVAAVAVARVGATLTMVNPLYTEYELASQMKGSRAKGVIVHRNFIEKATKALQMVGDETGRQPDHLIVLGGTGPEGSVSLDSMKKSDRPILTTVPGVVGDDLCALPYSSGTTGLPKGTMLTHDNIVVNMLQIELSESKFWKPDVPIISPLPMFHIYAYTVLMLQTAMKGIPLVTMSQFDLEKFCSLVEKYKCERAYLVPPICLGLSKHPVIDNYDMSSLEMIMCAAAPLGGDIEAACSKRIGCTVKQGWGMSELSPLGTIVPDDQLKSGSGSIGPLCSNTEAKIVDVETRKPVATGETGEFLIRGPQVMKGYLDAPDKTAECMEDGWFATGDIARADEDGYLYIVDRLKELIKFKGFQVAPAELEDVLSSHDCVADAVVIPVEDESAGQLPRAYVVIRDGASISATVLSDWVATRVAPHKRLRGGIVFTTEIPKTASGKILRRQVLEMDRAK